MRPSFAINPIAFPSWWVHGWWANHRQLQELPGYVIDSKGVLASPLFLISSCIVVTLCVCVSMLFNLLSINKRRDIGKENSVEITSQNNHYRFVRWEWENLEVTGVKPFALILTVNNSQYGYKKKTLIRRVERVIKSTWYTPTRCIRRAITFRSRVKSLRRIHKTLHQYVYACARVFQHPSGCDLTACITHILSTTAL